ncbi:MAG TPA: polyphosphate kinase [Anaeromyxobacteraceae bacterium]|nr:polyphosphate kinase [Anaeromyxobacteraceae bacterium]
MAHPSLSRLLARGDFPEVASKDAYQQRLEALQQRMLLVQRGIFHARQRAVIAVEGFDASGKGGAIRRLTEAVDPRGVKVVPIGPPAADEQGRHWLWRFWRELPPPGSVTVFDRTWYGRVLVERVEGLAGKAAWRRAYREINEFERALVEDGVDLVKIFLGVSKAEQLKRFEERLRDPYKQWKLSESDVRARRQWDEYVEAVDDAFARTDTPTAGWHLVAADRKWHARLEVLRIVTASLERHARWMEARAREKKQARHLEKALRRLS